MNNPDKQHDEQESRALTPAPAPAPLDPSFEDDLKGKADPLLAELDKSAATFAERQAAFQLASAQRQAVLIRKAAQALAALSWGKEIHPVARAAVARYCFEVGCDPLRHVFVLGGNIYFNAEFYRELVAANPEFHYDTVDYIHDDPRAPDDERQRRKVQRVLWGVPEAAPGAAVVRLFYRHRSEPIIGVNWAGVRQNDPVGKQEPTKTAHSRAYRKAAQKAEPTWFRAHPHLRSVESVVTSGREVAPDAVVVSEAARKALEAGQ